MDYLICPRFHALYDLHGSDAVKYYIGEDSDTPLNLHPDQFKVDRTTLHTWLTAALENTGAAHHVLNVRVGQGIEAYRSLLLECNSPEQKKSRAQDWEVDLLNRSFDPNVEDVATFIETLRADMAKYNTECKPSNVLTDGKQRDRLLAALVGCGDTDVEQFLKIVQNDTVYPTMDSVASYISIGMRAIYSKRQKEAARRARPNQRRFNLHNANVSDETFAENEDSEDGMDDFIVAMAYHQYQKNKRKGSTSGRGDHSNDKYHLTKQQYDTMTQSTKGKYRQARSEARKLAVLLEKMGGKHQHSEEETTKADEATKLASNLRPPRNELPRQYSAPTETMTNNLAHVQDQEVDEADSDDSSIDDVFLSDEVFGFLNNNMVVLNDDPSLSPAHPSSIPGEIPLPATVDNEASSVTSTSVFSNIYDGYFDTVQEHHASTKFPLGEFQNLMFRQTNGGGTDLHALVQAMPQLNPTHVLSSVMQQLNIPGDDAVSDYDDLSATIQRTEEPGMESSIDHQAHAETMKMIGYRMKAKHFLEDVEKVQPYLGFAPKRIISETLKRTTQMAKAVIRFPMVQHVRSRFENLRLKRIREVVATDTFFANIKSYDGFSCGQMFYGTSSKVRNFIGLRSRENIKQAIMYFVTTYGAPWAFRLDNATEQSAQELEAILRDLCIGLEYSEPYNQQQNPAELGGVRWIKDHVSVLMDRTGAVARAWTYAARYMCGVGNILANESIRYNIPLTVRYGETFDISAFLVFQFYEKVYYGDPSTSFPDSKEQPGYWLGPAESIGDLLTYHVLTNDTQSVLARSVVRPFHQAKANQRLTYHPDLDPHVPHPAPPVPLDFSTERLPLAKALHHFRHPPQRRSKVPKTHPHTTTQPFPSHPDPVPPASLPAPSLPPPVVSIPNVSAPLPTGLVVSPAPCSPSPSQVHKDSVERGDITPKDSDMKSTTPDIQQQEAPIITKGNLVKRYKRNVQDMEQKRKPMSTELRRSKRQRKKNQWFYANMLSKLVETAESMEGRAKIPNMSHREEQHLHYVMFCDYTNDVVDQVTEQKKVGRVIRSILEHRYKKTTNDNVELKVLWSTGEVQWVRHDDVMLDNPFVICKYAKLKGLETTDTFKWCTSFQHQANAIHEAHVLNAKAAKAQRGVPRYKFGVQLPNNLRHAFLLDKINGNNLWREALDKELNQLKEASTFRVPKDTEELLKYSKIMYHIVWDVKFDYRRKARLVANSKMTDPTAEDVYSGVVATETIRVAFAIAMINGLLVIAGDVGNAFLYAITNEKCYITAGEEFGDLAGQDLIIHKSLYGLRTSSARFHEHLAQVFRDLGFAPSKFDSDLWIRSCVNHYEMLTTYVDDILIFSKDPMNIMKHLQEKFEMKGVGVPEYYLGGNVETMSDEWKREGVVMSLSADTYIKRACERIESITGMSLRRHSTPMAEGSHPELDDSDLMDATDS
eukprot:Nitzschia sp. Nitz4//scaffold500_size4614//80//4514//NITZ4_009238-RA/size4614-augustus-gene-0.0-mRNA-1//-1//CDS//3329553583//636//frame0